MKCFLELQPTYLSWCRTDFLQGTNMSIFYLFVFNIFLCYKSSNVYVFWGFLEDYNQSLESCTNNLWWLGKCQLVFMLLAPVTFILIYSLWLSWKSINNCGWNLILELHIRRGWYSHVSGERPQNSLAPQTKSIGYLFKEEKNQTSKKPQTKQSVTGRF